MAIEREYRYVVTQIDPDVLRSASMDIQQGYFVTPDTHSLRVRITSEQCFLTRKSGRGIEREESEVSVEREIAEFLMGSCPYQVSKTRYYRDGWEVDFFHGPLQGLILAEFEHKEGDEVQVPSWFSGSDVTNTVTNLHLARLSHDLGESPSMPVRELLTTGIRRIVVTGGPCSGKSTALKKIQELSDSGELGVKVRTVPEAATIVFGQLKVRPTGGPLGDSAFQQRLYQVIRSFEEMSALQAVHDGADAVVFDRGTLDASAYLSGGYREFCRLMMTTQESELNRYDGVIYLDVAPQEAYEQNVGNNPERTEAYDQAVAVGSTIMDSYRDHKRFSRVRNRGGAEDKMWDTIEAVRQLAREDAP